MFCFICQQVPEEVQNSFDLRLHLNAHMLPCNNPVGGALCGDAALRARLSSLAHGGNGAEGGEDAAQEVVPLEQAVDQAHLGGEAVACVALPQPESALVHVAQQDAVLGAEEVQIDQLMGSLDSAQREKMDF